MSIYATIQTAITVNKLVNYGLKQQEQSGPQPLISRPFSTMPIDDKRTPSIKDSCLDYDNGCYYSPCYVIRYDEQQIYINEIVLFRVQIQAYFNQQFSDNNYKVIAQLLMSQLSQYRENISYNQFKSLATFQGTTAKSYQVHSFLPMQFERRFIGILDGIIDTTNFEFKYRSKTKGSGSKSFNAFLSQATNQFYPSSVKQFYNFYYEHSLSQFNNLKSVLVNRLRAINQQQMCPIKFPKEILYQKKDYRQFQVILSDFNSMAKSIYDLWSKLIRLNTTKIKNIISHQKSRYKSKLNQQWGWFVLRYQSKPIKYWNKSQYVKQYQNLAQQMRHKTKSPQALQIINTLLIPHKDHQPVIFQQFKKGRFAKIDKADNKHIIFLIHGFQANRFDLYSIRNMLLISYPNSQIICSQANQGQTNKSIDLQGRALATEIQNIIGRKQKNNIRLSFIGHSMGGLIIRAMVSFLPQALKNQLYMYCSLSTPHLGFYYGSSKLLQVGLWYLNRMQKVLSIQQICMQDSIDKRNSFLYELSKNRAFRYFKKVVLVSSSQDGYIPLQSSRIQQCLQAKEEKDCEKGRIYCDMIQNILRDVEQFNLHRLQVNMVISDGGTLDKLIGRTAHIKLLQDNVFLSMLTSCFDHLFK